MLKQDKCKSLTPENEDVSETLSEQALGIRGGHTSSGLFVQHCLQSLRPPSSVKKGLLRLSTVRSRRGSDTEELRATDSSGALFLNPYEVTKVERLAVAKIAQKDKELADRLLEAQDGAQLKA